MINISTDYSKENREKYLCKQGAFFSTVVMRDGLDDIDKKIINDIDNASISENNTIIGRFGITSLINISAGAKTLINLRYMLRKSKECYIDITSCGDNCIDLLVDILNNYDSTYSINLLTCLDNYISSKKIRMNVDNKYMVNCFSEIGDKKCIE